MIVSASRRCDIPAHFSEWFYQRIAEKYALTRNPMNPVQVSRIDLSPEVVDGIVFWSKNPEPMLMRLAELKEYTYYFQFTLNGYQPEVEAALPSVEERLDTFLRLSDQIGRERVIWRYDPILLNEKYTVAWHQETFARIAGKIAADAGKCVISFLDMYTKIKKNMDILSIREPSHEEKLQLAKALSAIAGSYRLGMESCAEDIPLEQFGITHGRCIDDRLLERLLGCSLAVKKDKNQRLACGCAASVDLGTYNTCLNGCRYCYANYQTDTVKKNVAKYQKDSPMLCGILKEADSLKEYPAKSLRDGQMRLFQE